MLRLLPVKFLIIVLLEGCSVLAIELLGAKMISAFYGSSIFVWTSVIGITLIALTAGYYIGGRVSSGRHPEAVLFYLLLCSAFFIACMPAIAQPLMKMTRSLGIIKGAVATAVFLIGLSLACLGTITPIIIRLSTKKIEEAGKISGFVYALTTVGGIATTFLTGFFIIPRYGITYPVIVVAVIIAYYSMYLFYSKSRMGVIALFSVIFLAEIGYVVKKMNSKYIGRYEILYESEGLLGQLKVSDDNENPRYGPGRRLYINGVPQTWVMKNLHRNSIWSYPHIISTISSVLPAGSQAALFGIGGGSIAKELTELGFRIDAIDIDKRVFELAKNYFFFDASNTTFTIDDARHYFRVNKKKYDLVVIDLLNGEVQPSYVFSLESFRELKSMLNENGIAIINFQSNPLGIGAHSIYKTLLRAGFYVNYTVNGPLNLKTIDVIYTLSLKPLDFSKVKFDRMNKCCERMIGSFFQQPSQPEIVDTAKAYLLVDDAPLMDHLNKPAIMEFRIMQSSAGSLIIDEIESGTNVFR